MPNRCFHIEFLLSICSFNCYWIWCQFGCTRSTENTLFGCKYVMIHGNSYELFCECAARLLKWTKTKLNDSHVYLVQSRLLFFWKKENKIQVARIRSLFQCHAIDIRPLKREMSKINWTIFRTKAKKRKLMKWIWLEFNVFYIRSYPAIHTNWWKFAMEPTKGLCFAENWKVFQRSYVYKAY